MSSDADIEAAFHRWQETKSRMWIAQSHLAEAVERGWTDHAREYQNRVNLYYEREQESFRLLMQLRGNSGISV